MVGSEVDHKYLGLYAVRTHSDLSAGLYKLLGLSTLLSRKLLRARKQRRRLDPTRPSRSHDLYKHIIWMAREGLVILQQSVLPYTARTPHHELHVLALKLNASFHHIFVLFDYTGTSSGTEPTVTAFTRADAAAMKHLTASHPLRLSVKLEFAAFQWDCMKDFETSRRIAREAVDAAFRSREPMDDEAFEDAMSSKSYLIGVAWGSGRRADDGTVVGALGAMAKRGLQQQQRSGSTPKTPVSEPPPPPPPPKDPSPPPPRQHLPALQVNIQRASLQPNGDITRSRTTKRHHHSRSQSSVPAPPSPPRSRDGDHSNNHVLVSPPAGDYPISPPRSRDGNHPPQRSRGGDQYTNGDDVSPVKRTGTLGPGQMNPVPNGVGRRVK